MRIISITALALGLMITSVDAQSVGGPDAAGGVGAGGFGGRHHGQQQKKAETPKPKADEKAYSAALKEIPNKPYDPWRGIH